MRTGDHFNTLQEPAENKATEPVKFLKILFVTQYFFPEHFSNNKIVKNLVARGHQVTVVTAIPNYPKGQFYSGYGYFKRKHDKFEGANIERVSVIPRGQNKIQLMLNYLSFTVTASLKVLRMKPGQFDVVLCSVPSPITIVIPAIVASSRMKIANLTWIQDLWPQSAIELLNIKNKFVNGALDRLCRWIYTRISIVLVPSNAFIPEIRRLAPEAKFQFFPNTLEDIHQPLPPIEDLRSKLELQDGDFVVMYAGNIGTAQNVDVIVDSAAILRDPSVHFVFLGDGRDRPRVEKRVEKEGLQRQIHFLGMVSPEDVTRHLSYADAAVLTLRDDPVFRPVVPYRLQTFLGCGKIVLASAAGETARIVDEVNCGFVSAPGDAEGLANNITRAMVLDRETRQEYQVRARRYAMKHYDETQVIDALEKTLVAMSCSTSTPRKSLAQAGTRRRS